MSSASQHPERSISFQLDRLEFESRLRPLLPLLTPLGDPLHLSVAVFSPTEVTRGSTHGKGLL